MVATLGYPMIYMAADLQSIVVILSVILYLYLYLDLYIS
jgi:hypothetical protein